MPVPTGSHKGREIDRHKQRGGKTITMTIFKCDQSYILEECRKIKISKFYLFACLPTHCCTGKSQQAEVDGKPQPSLPLTVLSFALLVGTQCPSRCPSLVQALSWEPTALLFLFMKNQHYYLLTGKGIRQDFQHIDRQIEKMQKAREAEQGGTVSCHHLQAPSAGAHVVPFPALGHTSTL